MTALDAPPSAAIRALLRALLVQQHFAGRDDLLAQLDSVEYVDGPVTMLDLQVVDGGAPASAATSPVHNRPTVVGHDGEMVGTLLLWLDDAGFIKCLEFAWVTDQMPTQLPHPDNLAAWPT